MAAVESLVPLRVHRLQHAHPPAHHVYATPPSASSAASWFNIGAYLPHWHAVPERFLHPRHRRKKSKHQQQDAKASEVEDPDAPPTELLRTGFQNPWPSFHRPTIWQIWHSLRWGVPPPHFDADMDEELHAGHRQRKKLRKQLQNDPELQLSIERPDFSYEQGTVKATWVGHAGTLVTLPPVSGRKEPFRVLFDPIFSDRCSPLRGAGPLRAYAPPCKLADLPPIDLVIISHNHYDHLDYDTISDLWAANESRGIRFIAPLGNKSWFIQEGLGIDAERVVELDWWDELVLGGSPVLPAPETKAANSEQEAAADEPKKHAEVVVPELVDGASFSSALITAKVEDPENPSLRTPGDSVIELSAREKDALKEPALPFVRIICTPAQHQSGRYAVDACSALWSSWVVEYHHTEKSDDGGAQGGKPTRRCFRTFFGGDTGYRFHDTVAAAAQEAKAKELEQKLERRASEEVKRRSGDGERSGAFRRMSIKLSERLSRSSGSKTSSEASTTAAGEASNGQIISQEGAKGSEDAADASKKTPGVPNGNKDADAKAEEATIQEDVFPACPAFEDITLGLGRPNLLLLPISVGATISFLKSYDPLPSRWSPFPRVDERLTSAVHMGPEDAVRVMQLMTTEAGSTTPPRNAIGAGDEDEDEDRKRLRAPASAHLRRYAHLEASPSAPSAVRNGATALAIHWGTFVGGKDEVLQSARALRRACQHEGVKFARQHREDKAAAADKGKDVTGKNTFALVNHGESVVLRL